MKSSPFPVISVSTHTEDDMRQVALILQDEMIIFINNNPSNKGQSLEILWIYQATLEERSHLHGCPGEWNYKTVKLSKYILSLYSFGHADL